VQYQDFTAVLLRFKNKEINSIRARHWQSTSDPFADNLNKPSAKRSQLQNQQVSFELTDLAAKGTTKLFRGSKRCTSASGESKTPAAPSEPQA